MIPLKNLARKGLIDFVILDSSNNFFAWSVSKKLWLIIIKHSGTNPNEISIKW